jgi:uncharacterized protein VirK/YbjX
MVKALIEQRKTAKNLMKESPRNPAVPLKVFEDKYWKIDSELNALSRQHNAIDNCLRTVNKDQLTERNRSLC